MTMINIMCFLLGIVFHKLYVTVRKYKKVKEEYDNGRYRRKQFITRENY